MKPTNTKIMDIEAVESDMWSLKSNFIRRSLHVFNGLILLGAIGLTLAGILLRNVYQYDHLFAREKIDQLTFVLLVFGVSFVLLGLLSFVSLTQCGNSMMHALIIVKLIIATALLTYYGVWAYTLYANDEVINLVRFSLMM